MFVRKGFAYVCLKEAVSGYEVIEKPYRTYSKYHKVTSEQIPTLIKEAIKCLQ